MLWPPDVVVPVDPVIEGQEVPAKGLYFSSSFEFELSSEVEDVLQRGSHFILC